ncbi:MAG: acetylornithine deacetylase, partial [Myxococcota bacterium]
SNQPELDQPNRGVVDQLAEWGEGVGGRTRILAVPTLPGKVNLITTFGPDSGETAGLMLSGHTDTVPCNPELWTSDPWKPEVRDGRMYGLGSADMKGFLALALHAAARVGDLKRPLTLLATADEESGMDGAKALVDEGLRLADRVIIGEPTGGQPVRMHKGIMMCAVDIAGRSGHSSRPLAGANAIDGLSEVLVALDALRRRWAEQYRAPEFDVAEPTMNFGQVTGGDAPNRICGQCTLTFDVRLVPGMDEAQITRELTEAIAGIGRESRVTARYYSMFPTIPPFENPVDSPLTRAVEAESGCTACAVLFGTEAPFFHALDMDTVVMGPGSIDVAHQPNECIDVAEFAPTVDQLERLIRKFCC